MDIKLFVLMLATCLCGGYENSFDLPPPSQGNLAHAVEGSEHSNKLALRFYGRYPGEISGIFMTRNIYVVCYIYLISY